MEGDSLMDVHEHVADALDLWRDGERLARRRTSPAWRTDYERAIAAALAKLQRCTTMAGLMDAYFDKLDVPLRADSGRVLNVGIVEDAAFWRRARQLIAGSGG
jgi:hypothetical protein